MNSKFWNEFNVLLQGHWDLFNEESNLISSAYSEDVFIKRDIKMLKHSDMIHPYDLRLNFEDND